MEKINVIFTGGGTGGHVYPNIAIYEAIKEKYPGSSFLYIGTKKGAESRIVKNLPHPIEFVDVPSRGLPQNLKSFDSIISLIVILIGMIKSYFILKRFKPDIVIGSGGYVAAPVLFAASFLKIKSFIHEQNAVPGRLNRFIARFASRIGVSFSSTANFFPENKVVVTGYPLRKSIRLNKSVNVKQKYKIPEKNKVVFIFGGSGGSRTINNSVAEIIPMLLAIDDLTVILSTGRGYSNEYKAYDDTIKIFENIGITPEIEGRLIVREYFDNIDEIYSITDLIVSRAGAGTIKEITTMGIPCILIPKIDLPGDHQILNAREIEKIGGARIVYETIAFKNNKQTIYVPEESLLDSIKSTLFDSDTLFNMRRNLRKVEKQNSTELIIKELEQLLKGNDQSDETQIKVYYLQPREGEKSIELIFDTTTIGTTSFCDSYLEGMSDDVVFQLKILKSKTDEKLIVRKLRGVVRVDGIDVEKWSEVTEDSIIELGQSQRAFFLKSYYEKVQKIQIPKSALSINRVLSPGILFSKIGGFFREIVMAAYFGAGTATDIFAVALTVTYFFRRILGEHALGNAFLPIFSQAFQRNSRKKSWESASSVINFTLILSFLVTILMILFSPTIIISLFKGFVVRNSAHDAIGMTQLILPYLFLFSIASVLITYFKAFNRFGIAEASTFFFSLGTIIGIMAYYHSSGLYSMAYGVLIGGVMQIIFLLIFAVKTFRIKSLQFSYRPVLKLKSPFNKKYYSQLVPISMDVVLFRTADVVGKMLASGIGEGIIAFLHFSLILFQLPFSIVTQFINSKILNILSEQIAFFDKKRVKQLFIDGIIINLFMFTPISVLIIFLANPLVSVLLERGNFTQANVAGTALALQYYALGLIGWGLHTLTIRFFKARGETKTSIAIHFLMISVNILLSVLLVKTFLSFKGLALATSISFTIFAMVRIGVLKRKLAREDIIIRYKDMMGSIFKTFMAALLMVIILFQAQSLFNKMKFGVSPFVENLVLLISLSFIGISVYFLASLMLKNTGLLAFKKKTKRGGDVPISMLSPFRFLEKVSKNPDIYRDDYFYKINIYLFSTGWEVRNIGIKLIGLFKDSSKVNYLVDLLKSGEGNGFMRRNAVQALKTFGNWNAEIKNLMIKLLDDSYYEVRSAVIEYVAKSASTREYSDFKEIVHRRLKSSKYSMEEKLVILKLIARVGDKDEILFVEDLLMTSNSLIREELLELFYSFYRRKLLTLEELKDYIGRILITSNNMNPEFKLKAIIKKIYKEIE